MTVYFIQSGHEGPIKIGHTSGDVISRVNNLQTGNPSMLSVLACLDGGRALELSLHNKFAIFRFRNEWFYPSHEILSFISSLSPAPDVAPPVKDTISVNDSAAQDLRLAVKRSGITQKAASSKIGVSQGYFSRFLTGTRVPSLSVACLIESEFGVPASSWMTAA